MPGQVSDNDIIIVNVNLEKVGAQSFKYFLGFYLTLFSNALLFIMDPLKQHVNIGPYGVSSREENCRAFL